MYEEYLCTRGNHLLTFRWRVHWYFLICFCVRTYEIYGLVYLPWYGQLTYNTIQCNVIQYNSIQYSTIQYNTMQYKTIQFNSIQYNTIQYNTVQCSAVCRSVQHNAIQNNAMHCNAILWYFLDAVLHFGSCVFSTFIRYNLQSWKSRK